MRTWVACGTGPPHNIGNRGGGSYTYKVCAAGTTTCSNEANVSF
jgi:hypothetical protein